MGLRLSEVYFFALLTWLAVTQGGAIKSPLYWSPLSEAYLEHQVCAGSYEPAKHSCYFFRIIDHRGIP